jgi:hypothetical protein
MALDQATARANLTAWARAGITLVRDVGSAGEVTLELGSGPGMPVLQAAGRFLGPAGRYFPALLGDPVAEADLVRCAPAPAQDVWVPVPRRSRMAATASRWLSPEPAANA